MFGQEIENIKQNIYEKYFSSKPGGILVEIGAGHPTYLSMSYEFRSYGWRTISVEANPEFVVLHKDAGNEIYEYAISNENKRDKFLIYKKGDDILSSQSYSSLGIKPTHVFNKNITKESDDAYHKRMIDSINPCITEIDVEVVTLNWLLKKLDIKKIDFLAIDTEGWELEVLNGTDLEKYDPKIILIENTNKNIEYEEYLEKKNYQLEETIAINQIYKRKENA